eukprot:COSAG05_NODE_130_length_17165_cov_154.623638_17_plen_230_part_00
MRLITGTPRNLRRASVAASCVAQLRHCFRRCCVALDHVSFACYHVSFACYHVSFACCHVSFAFCHVFLTPNALDGVPHSAKQGADPMLLTDKELLRVAKDACLQQKRQQKQVAAAKVSRDAKEEKRNHFARLATYKQVVDKGGGPKGAGHQRRQQLDARPKERAFGSVRRRRRCFCPCCACATPLSWLLASPPPPPPSSSSSSLSLSLSLSLWLLSSTLWLSSLSSPAS